MEQISKKTLDKSSWIEYINKNKEINFCMLMEMKNQYETLKEKKNKNKNEKMFIEAWEEICNSFKTKGPL